MTNISPAQSHNNHVPCPKLFLMREIAKIHGNDVFVQKFTVQFKNDVTMVRSLTLLEKQLDVLLRWMANHSFTSKEVFMNGSPKNKD